MFFPQWPEGNVFWYGSKLNDRQQKVGGDFNQLEVKGGSERGRFGKRDLTSKLDF